MENKKEIKISLKKAIIIIVSIIIALGIITICAFNLNGKKNTNQDTDIVQPTTNINESFNENENTNINTNTNININTNINKVQPSTNSEDTTSEDGESVDFEVKTIEVDDLQMQKEGLSLEDNKMFKNYSDLETYISEIESKINTQLKFSDKTENVSVMQFFNNFDFENNTLMLCIRNNSIKTDNKYNLSKFVYTIDEVCKKENNDLTVFIQNYIMDDEFWYETKDIIEFKFIIIPDVKGKNVDVKTIEIKDEPDENPISATE